MRLVAVGGLTETGDASKPLEICAAVDIDRIRRLPDFLTTAVRLADDGPLDRDPMTTGLSREPIVDLDDALRARHAQHPKQQLDQKPVTRKRT